MLCETLILIVQSALMLLMKEGILLYIVEAALLALMIFMNIRPIQELVGLIINKFLKRGRKN